MIIRKSLRVGVLLVGLLFGSLACSFGGVIPAPGASPAGINPGAATEAPALTPSATLPPAATDLPATATPLDEGWDDRSIYSAGLAPDEQKWLGELKGASVYHLEIQIADDALSLQGRERVRYTNRASVALDAIYFQLFPNMEGGKSEVSGVLVDGKAAQAALDADLSSLAVPLPTPLQPGQSTVLQLDFQVEVPTGTGGNYGLFAFSKDILVLDGFYPAIPVYDAQGWHHGPLPANADTTFQDASFYLVRVRAPDTLILAASGNQVDRALEGSQQVVTFAAGPARDFYMAGSEYFVEMSRTVAGTQVNVYTLPGQTDGTNLALDTAAAALAGYSKRIGSYPYSEFDLVSTPMQGAFGIEYPGIVGINLDLFDLTQKVNGVPAPSYLEGTVAHVVGHQWLYNVVGNDQHKDPWLDEALTQYITGTYYLDRYGSAAFSSYRESWTARWERVDRALIPIGLPAASYQDREYGAIVYGRGPLFFEALAKQMGQPVFDEFLRDYFQVYHWGIATPAGFQQLAEKHCSCDLKSIFAEWVYPK